MPGSPLVTRLRNRTERLRQYAWRHRAYRSEERHVVVGGAPRSGTTLLRRILDRHPGLCAGAETKLFVPAGFNLAWLSRSYGVPLDELERLRRASPSQGAFIDAFAGLVRAASGKGRWVEKTPMNIRYLEWIVARFPRVAIVHLIRDGRDVVCSMREHPDWRWMDGEWHKVLVPRPLEWYARRWVRDTAEGMRWRGDPRYVEVRYEDLVNDPLRELQRLCTAIGEPADREWLAVVTTPESGGPPAAARPTPEGHERPSPAPGGGPGPDDRGPISGASIGRWQRDLGVRDQATVTAICRDRLAELGYPV